MRHNITRIDDELTILAAHATPNPTLHDLLYPNPICQCNSAHFTLRLIISYQIYIPRLLPVPYSSSHFMTPMIPLAEHEPYTREAAANALIRDIIDQRFLCKV